MVERTLCMREARGSMPLSSKISLFSISICLLNFFGLRILPRHDHYLRNISIFATLKKIVMIN